MNQLLAFLAECFKWTLSVSAMASVLVVIILLIKMVFKNRLTVRWHYLIWFVLVLRLVLPWVPESSFSIYNLFDVKHQVSLSLVETLNARPTSNVVFQQAPIMQQEDKTDIVPLSVSTPSSPSNLSMNIALLWNILIICWLSGLLLMGLYLFVINKKFVSKVRKSTPVADEQILYTFAASRSTMAISTNISLLKTDLIQSPTLFGFWRPRILLSENALKSLNQKELNHIFLHELAHFKRKDIAINWLMTILLLIHWFNPLLWYAFYRMRSDQEVSCDALALWHMDESESTEYGFTMIKIFEQFANPPRIPGITNFSGNKTEIWKRITMIKLFKRNSYRWSVLGLVLVILLSTVALTNTKTKVSTLTEKSAQQKSTITKGDKEIEDIINKIVNDKNVGFSSNPNDYILANQASFKKIVEHGEIGFQFLLAELGKSPQDGLREWIMAKACEAIVQDSITIKEWSTGKGWLKEYKAAAASSPLTVVQTFYYDLMHKEYDNAYSLLDPLFPKDQLVARWKHYISFKNLSIKQPYPSTVPDSVMFEVHYDLEMDQSDGIESTGKGLVRRIYLGKLDQGWNIDAFGPITPPGVASPSASKGVEQQNPPLTGSEFILYENSKYNFTLKLPKSWDGKYEVLQSSYGEGVDFFDKANRAYSGLVFGINVWNKADWAKSASTALEMGHTFLLGEKGDKVFTLNTPGDVNYDPHDEKLTTEYASMWNDVKNIQTTFEITGQATK